MELHRPGIDFNINITTTYYKNLKHIQEENKMKTYLFDKIEEFDWITGLVHTDSTMREIAERNFNAQSYIDQQKEKRFNIFRNRVVTGLIIILAAYLFYGTFLCFVK